MNFIYSTLFMTKKCKIFRRTINLKRVLLFLILFEVCILQTFADFVNNNSNIKRSKTPEMLG